MRQPQAAFGSGFWVWIQEGLGASRDLPDMREAKLRADSGCGNAENRHSQIACKSAHHKRGALVYAAPCVPVRGDRGNGKSPRMPRNDSEHRHSRSRNRTTPENPYRRSFHSHHTRWQRLLLQAVPGEVRRNRHELLSSKTYPTRWLQTGWYSIISFFSTSSSAETVTSQ
jgi:hypothetical protein